jgi:TrmH family RNA methyltransferase
MPITSRDNSLLRHARSVRDGKDDDLIFVEGLRLADEALRSGLKLEAVIFSDELARKEKAAEVISNLSKVSARAASLSEKLLESISYTKTPQGIVVLARRPTAGKQRLEASLKPQSLLVVLHTINNPVNVGAILRTAEAAGVTGVITTANTSDPFSPKSLRGAMGSAFRLPIWPGAQFDDVIDWCKQHSISSLCADAGGPVSYLQVDWTRASALILGPESTGFAPKELEGANQTVNIPMQGTVESLNVSVAAGIVLFEAARQRART